MPKASKQLDKNDPEYLEKRKRNNEAIKKSREKAKAKAEETQKKVNELKSDNKRLEDKISVLGKEMQFLKDIFLAHAGANTDAAKAHQVAEGEFLFFTLFIIFWSTGRYVGLNSRCKLYFVAFPTFFFL